MTMDQAMELFFINRKARNLSKYTLRWYKLIIEVFGKHCEEHKLVNVEDIKSYHIELFFSQLRETRGIRDVSVKDYYVVLKVFFNFLFNEEYIERHPMRNMRQPKVEKKIMRTFTKQEIEKILKGFDTSDFFGLRNYMIMCMFFSTGIRKAELLGLKMQDISYNLDVFKVRGKGSRERIVPIGRTLRRIMIQYTNQRTEYLKDSSSEYFIISQKKRNLTNAGLNRIFDLVKKELNIQGERVSAHSWRHTFAKNYLLNGGSVFDLQKIIGHSDLQMTRKYVELNDKELKTQYAKFNPLDNRDWSI